MKEYVISKEESERLNILKCIATIFVVYIHAYAVEVNYAGSGGTLLIPQWLLLFQDLISQTISRCAVPIFFLCSSILLFKKQRKYTDTIKSRMKTILLPYLIWNTFWIIIFIFLQNFSFTSIYFSGSQTPILKSSFKEWLALYGIEKHFAYPHSGALWYMRDLMIVTFFFPIIGKIANKFPKQLLFGAIIMLLVPINFPLKVAFLWFCLGAAIVELDIHLMFLDHVSLFRFSLLYAVCAIVTLLTNNYTIDTMFIMVGIIYWVRVTRNILCSQKLRSFFTRFSRWIFIVYVTHELILTSLKKICFRLFPTTPIWIFMCYVLLPVFVIVGCCVFGYIFKRVFPKIYSFATGER